MSDYCRPNLVWDRNWPEWVWDWTHAGLFDADSLTSLTHSKCTRTHSSSQTAICIYLPGSHWCHCMWVCMFLCISMFVQWCMFNRCVHRMLFLPSVALDPLISQSLPAKSVTGPGYGPLILILAQAIDSQEAQTTDLSLWLAVNTLRVTLCHQEKKGRGKKVNESNRRGSDGNVR